MISRIRSTSGVRWLMADPQHGFRSTLTHGRGSMDNAIKTERSIRPIISAMATG